MKTLFIIKGLPGSGKSTIAQQVAPLANAAADDFFDEYYNGKFIPQKIKNAHEWCRLEIQRFMEIGHPVVAVHNTFTQPWESKPYFDLAEKHGYMVHSIIVENHHGNRSIHQVPPETVAKMKERFIVSL